MYPRLVHPSTPSELCPISILSCSTLFLLHIIWTGFYELLSFCCGRQASCQPPRFISFREGCWCSAFWGHFAMFIPLRFSLTLHIRIFIMTSILRCVLDWLTATTIIILSSRFTRILEATRQNIQKVLKKCFLGILCIVMSATCLKLPSHSIVLLVLKGLIVYAYIYLLREMMFLIFLHL